MTTFKYGNQLKSIPNCPDRECQPGERESYRYVFKGRMADSLLPVLVMNPRRGFKNDKETCGGWALSFFTSEDLAALYYQKLQRTVSNIRKAVGDALAKGLLKHGDGVMSPPEGDGHFELHEYDNVNLASRFTIVRDLL